MSRQDDKSGAWAVSIASGLFLAFAAGAVMATYRLPPYGLLMKGKTAVQALMSFEDDAAMTSLTELDPAAPARPVAETLDPGAGTEALLLTGGFYQDMEECPSFGCLARVIDRQGNTLAKWELDPQAIAGAAPEEFSGRFSADNIYPIGIKLVPGGDLIVSFHSRNSFPYQAGIARIARDGRVVWVDMDHSHHWIDAAPDGTSVAPSARVIETPDIYPGTAVPGRCHDNKTLDEGIRVRDGDGKILRDYWMQDVLVQSGYPGLLYSLRDGCDPYHVNSVQVVRPEIAAVLPGVEAGDYLISAREPGLIAIIGASDGQIRMAAIGRTAAQHSAHFLPDGTVVAFDNLGAASGETAGTRVARIDLRTGTASTVYPREGVTGTLPLWSPDGGTLAVSADGSRIMISSKTQSTAIEIDTATGRPLWTLKIGYDISAYKALKGAKLKADRGWFNAYGLFYLTDEEAAALAG